MDDEPIPKNVTGCNINWREIRSLIYRDFNKNKIPKIGRREGQICTVNKRERTDSFFHFFR